MDKYKTSDTYIYFDICQGLEHVTYAYKYTNIYTYILFYMCTYAATGSQNGEAACSCPPRLTHARS